MEIIVDFPGGARVDAHFGSFTIPTDQPPPSGTSSAPTPFATFSPRLVPAREFTFLAFAVSVVFRAMESD